MIQLYVYYTYIQQLISHANKIVREYESSFSNKGINYLSQYETRSHQYRRSQTTPEHILSVF